MRTQRDVPVRARLSTIRMCIAAVLVLAGGAVGAESEPATPGEEAAALEERIGQLRAEGLYEEAVPVARKLVEAREQDASCAAFEAADARWSLLLLEHAASLSPAEQAELAMADTLGLTFDRLLQREQLTEALDAVERQLEIRRRLLPPECPECLGSEFRAAKVACMLGRYDEAESRLRRILEEANTIGYYDHPLTTAMLGQLGHTLRFKGDLSGAEVAYRRALEMSRNLCGPEHSDIALACHNLASLLQATGDTAEAEGLYDESLHQNKKIHGEGSQKVATVLNSLGAFSYRRGDYETAEARFREAAEITRANLGEHSTDLAPCLNNLATTLQAQGKYQQVIPLYRQTLGIVVDALGYEHTYVATTLQNIAGALVASNGDLHEAARLTREALDLRRRVLGEESPDVAYSLMNLGHILVNQGDLTRAETYMREALALRRRLFDQDHAEVASSLSSLGNVLAMQGDVSGGESLMKEALAMRIRVLGEQHPDVAETTIDIAEMFYRAGELEPAEEYCRRAVRLHRDISGERHPSTAVALHTLGVVLTNEGRYEEAEPLLREAVEIRRETLGEDHPSLAMSLLALAHQREAVGDIRGAAEILSEASRIYDAARVRAGEGYTRTTFFLPSPYPDLALMHVLQQEWDQAWDANERALARSLFDLLATADTLPESEDEPVVTAQAYSLERVQSAMPESLALVGWLDTPEHAQRFGQWAYVVRSEGDVRWIELDGVEGAQAGSQDPLTPASLRPGLVEPTSSAVAVGREARSAFEYFLEPVVEELEGVKGLVVVAPPQLAGVPIEVFEDAEGTLLGDRFAVSYAPSATVYAWIAEGAAGREQRSDRTLIVGDPELGDKNQVVAMTGENNTHLRGGGTPFPGADLVRAALSGSDAALAALPPLLGAREEARTIAALAPEADLLLGPEATERALRELATKGELADYGTLHFATHALVDDEHPEQSAIVLSRVEAQDVVSAAIDGAPVDDGLVTAAELVRDWELNADLVSLSACETGLGKDIRGEGYVGLAHAFLQAGSRSLLVSLWKVDDRATSLLMRRFYESYFSVTPDGDASGDARGTDKARALQDAKRWLRDYTDEGGEHPYDHPYYWSAFILIGDRSRAGVSAE